jgi:hypothetical protein
MSLSRAAFVFVFFTSFSALADETKCFELFGRPMSVFQSEVAYGLVFKEPGFENFMKIFNLRVDIWRQLPSMPPPLAEMAIVLVNDYEPAVSFVAKVYNEIFDPQDPGNSLQLVDTYYRSMILAKIIGTNVTQFESITHGSVEEGMMLLQSETSGLEKMAKYGVQ